MSRIMRSDKPVVFMSDTLPIKVEQLSDKKYRFQTVGSVANVINGNNRVIPMSVQREAIEDWKRERWQLTSYIGHPEPGQSIKGDMKELAGLCDIIDLNEAGETQIKITPLESTEEGVQVKGMFDEGVQIGVSQRALGIQSVREDDRGNMFIVVEKIVKILGYDFCLLDEAAAGDRTQLRLVDTVEMGRIVNMKRIEDESEQEDGPMEKLIEQNKKLIESVTALVDAIGAKMAGDSSDLPKEIVDSFDSLKQGVENLKTDTVMDETKKNAHLVKVSEQLTAIVDSIVTKPAEAPVVPAAPVIPAVVPVEDTTKIPEAPVVPAVEAPKVTAQAEKAADLAITAVTDTAKRLKEFVETEKKRRDAEAHVTKMGKHLMDTVTALEVPDDAKKQILDTLKVRSFDSEAIVDSSVKEIVNLINLGVAQERMKQEGITPKGATPMADITVGAEHLKGVEILTDQILGTGIIGSKREAMIKGEGRSPVLRQFLKMYDQMYGANLKAEAAQMVALMDATQTPADFQVPYSISRIVLEEVYADYMIERLTDFGPMASKRDQIPLTVYRREGGLAATRNTRKPSKARINELKPGEFGAMAKGKLTTSWYNIDATSSKLQAAFSDEFATLSKRTPSITGVSRGIANLILDLRRSLQQMVFADMRNAAMGLNSVTFTFNGTGNGSTSLFAAVSGASISLADAITVTVNAVAINEFEVSTSGTIFYTLDAANGKIQFVDAAGAPSNITNTHAIVVSGKKVTNEVRFSLTPEANYTWERWMNKLLFATGNQAASMRQTRGYKPEFLLASEVTAQYMTQADAYAAQSKRNGFTADSVVGEGNYGQVSNLPLFGSDVWDDNFILLSQKDATIFRIFEPLSLKGPYPTRDTNGALTGGDEYYVYQEDALKTPVAEKLSLITVVA